METRSHSSSPATKQGRPMMPWERAAAPTMLSAPDGSRVEQKATAADADKNMGSMWTRVQ